MILTSRCQGGGGYCFRGGVIVYRSGLYIYIYIQFLYIIIYIYIYILNFRLPFWDMAIPLFPIFCAPVGASRVNLFPLKLFGGGAAPIGYYLSPASLSAQRACIPPQLDFFRGENLFS